MKRLAVALLVASSLVGAVAVVGAFQKQNFTLVNKTGLTIEEVYVSAVNKKTWGSDVMGKDVLPNGGKVDIKFDRSQTACHWDMKIIDSRKDEYTWDDINLCECDVLTLKYDPSDKTLTSSCTAPTRATARR
jgi:hypothetical protein